MIISNARGPVTLPRCSLFSAAGRKRGHMIELLHDRSTGAHRAFGAQIKEGPEWVVAVCLPL